MSELMDIIVFRINISLFQRMVLPVFVRFSECRSLILLLLLYNGNVTKSKLVSIVFYIRSIVFYVR